MPSWKHHVFVCTNKRPPGHPKGSCADRGSMDLLMALKEGVEARELGESVKINGSSCLGPCLEGPTVVVYPEGVWYGRVRVEDVQEIVESHLADGRPVERLQLRE